MLPPFLNGRALMQNFVQAKQKDQQWSPKIAIKCSKLELLCSACTLTGTNIGRDQYLLYGLPFGILHTTFFTSYCFNLYGSSSSLDMHDPQSLGNQHQLILNQNGLLRNAVSGINFFCLQCNFKSEYCIRNIQIKTSQLVYL